MKKFIQAKLLALSVNIAHNQRVKLFMGAVALVGVLEPGMANASGLPFEGVIQQVAQSMCGPIAKSAAVMAIVVTGLLIAFTEISGIFKTMLGLLFGISFALLATQWIPFITNGASSSGFTCG
jgi:type IV secretion system protein VirB2